MFDFKKLIVYENAKQFSIEIHDLLKEHNYDRTVNDQLKRASLSIMLNIAEGSSRFSNRDRKNFLVIARGSAFECSAIFDYLFALHLISDEEKVKFENQLEEISKMLFSLIQKLL